MQSILVVVHVKLAEIMVYVVVSVKISMNDAMGTRTSDIKVEETKTN